MLFPSIRTSFQSSLPTCGLAQRLHRVVGLLALTLCVVPALHAAEPVLQAPVFQTPVFQTPVMDPKTYDLKSRQGVLAVYERVQTIAEQHCVASSNLAQALSAIEQACRDRILAQLLSKLADPYLSYLHENPEAQRLARR